MCPFKLAANLDVTTMPLRNFATQEPDAYEYLKSKVGKKEFSALTICYGMQRLVIYNCAHSKGRIAADVAHELSHIILLHPAKPPFDESGSRHYCAGLEEEANWLGPALLVSEEAALLIGKSGWSAAVAATHYGVSKPLLQMRMNVLGIAKRVAR
jgi:Zn-dependent peptidase ImmA (M78 family)